VGNAMPDPVWLTVADVGYPLDHGITEPYEGMAVTLQNVLVGQKDLGKEADNYELIQHGNIAWATDYMNVDAGAPYDPRIVTGVRLQSITGVLEQYTYGPGGWDYYQLCTRSAEDIAPVPIPTVTGWGLAVLALLLGTTGTVMLRRSIEGRCVLAKEQVRYRPM
jgi:hypothetical protein